MFEEYLLKLIKRLTIVTVKLYGLWPYCFNLKSKSFTTSAFLLVYSMLFPVATLTIFFIYYNHIFAGIKRQYASIAINLIDGLFLYLLAFSYITLYVGNYFKFNKVKKLILIGIHVYERSIKSGKSYLRLLIMFLVKSLICDFLYNYAIITGAFLHSKSQYANFFGAIFITLPPTVVRLVPNLYYCCILSGQLYYHKINNQIKSLCMTIRKDFEKDASTNDRICDEFDKLCVDHIRLTKLINECNKMCSLQVVLYIINQIIATIFNVLIQIASIKRGTHEDNSAISLIVFVLAIYDLYTTFAVCDHIVCEVI